MTPIIPQKTCSKCKELKPVTEYTKDKQKTDGFRSDCKVCSRNRIKADRVARPEHYHEIEVKRYWGNREARLAKKKRAYHENIEENRAHKRDLRTKNIERERERDRLRHTDARRIANRNRHKIRKHLDPDYQKAASHRRLARKRNLPYAFTSDDWSRCLEYFNHRCAVCGRPQGLWHIIAADHWIALADLNCPGTIPSNIIPLCHAKKDGTDGCNNRKKDVNPKDWVIRSFGDKEAKKILARVEGYFSWLIQQLPN